MTLIKEYYAQWERIAEATRVLLIPESNLDRDDPESLMYCED